MTGSLLPLTVVKKKLYEKHGGLSGDLESLRARGKDCRAIVAPEEEVLKKKTFCGQIGRIHRCTLALCAVFPTSFLYTLSHPFRTVETLWATESFWTNKSGDETLLLLGL